MKNVFKALNDETRREILSLLRKRDMTAGEIADHFQLGKPTISHHLELLRKAGLIASEKKGHYISYSLNTTVLDDLLQWLVHLKKGKK